MFQVIGPIKLRLPREGADSEYCHAHETNMLISRDNKIRSRWRNSTDFGWHSEPVGLL